jgi:site-specific recombinase XerC
MTSPACARRRGSERHGCETVTELIARAAIGVVPFGVPALVAAAGEQARRRFLEFFASAIRNPHTRRAYARAAADFPAWCDGAGVASPTAVQPHVVAWIELQTQEHAAPTAKQCPAALRHLSEWLVTSQVLPVNRTAAMRGPRHSAAKGKAPVLDAAAQRCVYVGCAKEDGR